MSAALPPQYDEVRRLEAHLGLPERPSSHHSFQAAAELDAAGAFPAQAFAHLEEQGLARHHVLARDGGATTSLETLGALYRCVARRDLTLAVAYFKTFLGSLAVWVGGDEAQRTRLANVALANRRVALAMSEREHGSDLQATETTSTMVDGGYALTGEKWLINNATASDALTVLATTDPGAGVRATTYFLVEKARLPPATFAHLPKVRTHGVRGMELSGIRFDRAPLASTDMIGERGSGIELTLRFLQINKTLISHLSMGACDTALRLVTRFALERVLYRAPAFAIPHVQDSLADAFADALVADALAVASSRALHVVPAQMSVIAPVSKLFVTVRVEEIIKRLSVLLGARHFVAEGPYATFEKLMRDNALMSLFDGSTVVNLSHIAAQLPAIASARASSSRARALFDVHAALSPLDVDQLVLSARGENDLWSSLSNGVERLRDAPPIGLEEPFALIANRIDEERASLEDALRSPAPARSSAAIAKARRFCALQAIGAALGAWTSSQDAFIARGAWLAVGVYRLLMHDREDLPTSVAVAREELKGELRHRLDGESYGIVRLPFS